MVNVLSDLRKLWYLLRADSGQVEHHQTQAGNGDWLLAWSPAKAVWQSLLLEKHPDPIKASLARDIVASHGLEVDSCLTISEDELSKAVGKGRVLRLGVSGPVGDGLCGGQKRRHAAVEVGKHILPIRVIE